MTRYICFLLVLLITVLIPGCSSKPETNEFFNKGYQGSLWRYDGGYSMDTCEIMINHLDKSSVTLFPTVVHVANRYEFGEDGYQRLQFVDFESLSILEDFISSKGTGTAETSQNAIEFPTPGKIWEALIAGQSSIRIYNKRNPLQTDYLMLVEVLIAPVDKGTDEEVWGINYYIVDRDSKDLYTIMLFDHWKIMSDANLRRSDSSDESRRELVQNAVQVAVDSLQSHIEYFQKNL